MPDLNHGDIYSVNKQNACGVEWSAEYFIVCVCVSEAACVCVCVLFSACEWNHGSGTPR